jgi:hypothetical protein
LEILAEKIHDNRFLNLLQGLLKAGYLEDWKYNHTYSGAPQGGVLSPLLSNIYLDQLDQYVERILTPKYTKGDRKATNPAYVKIQTLKRAALHRNDKVAYKELTKQLQRLPSQDPNDPNYVRLKYVRYADDVRRRKAAQEEALWRVNVREKRCKAPTLSRPGNRLGSVAWWGRPEFCKPRQTTEGQARLDMTRAKLPKDQFRAVPAKTSGKVACNPGYRSQPVKIVDRLAL